MSNWRLTAAFKLHSDGEYAVDLECGDVHATALIELLDRARPCEPWDPEVYVHSCTSELAREWLEAAEHERFVADCCLEGVDATYARHAIYDAAQVQYGRALRLLRGEAVSL